MPEFDLKTDLQKLMDLYPKLRYIPDTHKMSGDIDLFDSDGRYVETFTIRLEIPRNYPFAFPLFFETNNRFPHTPERHFNGNDSCCVCSLQEMDLESSKGITLVRYMKKYGLAFLANQIHFETKGKWANGEYDHDAEGILQFYRELLPRFDEIKIAELLKQIADEKTSVREVSDVEHLDSKALKTLRALSLERILEDILYIDLLKDRLQY